MSRLRFYIGLHVVAHARRFDRCMISVNRLRERKSDFHAGEWMLDSGAFTEISTHGHYRSEPRDYVAQVRRWSRCGRMVAAVTQDYMCEPFIVARTGLTIREHQLLTVDRYHELSRLAPDLPWMPVLQGYEPGDYVRHIIDYGRLLPHGRWIGVGSVCKRNSDPSSIEDVLLAIHRARPDLRLHGFGLKKTALASGIVRQLLFSADSMAWSWSARKQGRNANCPEEAARYVREVHGQEWQQSLMLPAGAA
jgi:hypothetical protein